MKLSANYSLPAGSVDLAESMNLTVGAQVSRTSLFTELLRALSEAQLTYCVLAGYEEYPWNIPSDVDLMISPKDVASFCAVLRVVCDRTGARIVQLLQHETTAGYFVLSYADGATLSFLQPDYSTDYRRSGKIWLFANSVLANRRLHPSGFYVPSPADEFAYYLIKRIDKGEIDEKHRSRLETTFRRAPHECETRLSSILPADSAASVAQAAATGNWQPALQRLSVLKQELHSCAPFQGLWRRLIQTALEIKRRWFRVVRPTGLCVGVLGPDGAGKTLVIDSIIRDLHPAFRSTHYEHLQPSAIKKRGNGIAVTDPHGRPPRGHIASVAKLGYFYLDFLLGYWLKIRPKLIRSTLVVFDRYYHDLLVDPRRYRYGAPLWLARVLSHVVPTPDIWLILVAPAEVLQNRKAEVSFEECARQVASYGELAATLKNAFIVNAAQPPGLVLAEAYDQLLTYLANRLSLEASNL